MNKEELLVVAKELGIENADSLAYNDLKKAVSKAKKALEVAKDNVTNENMNSEAQQTKGQEADTANVPIESESKSEVLEDNEKPEGQEFEIKPIEAPNATDELVKNLGDQKNDAELAIKKALNVREEVLTNLGEEDKSENQVKEYYEDDQGRKYVFSSFAPEKFRFNNQIKTKEEWLQDSEAMEQLVFGNSAYVEQIFND
ncbi:hypothetical protein [Aquimarina algiphila]|uniref:hypothetical protein n=1 Tax=Aquimarina algiphila TaxID=2047982 RepID=UPI002330AAC4|nr:hypothetical protein [Aquimarina algiphila]